MLHFARSILIEISVCQRTMINKKRIRTNVRKTNFVDCVENIGIEPIAFPDETGLLFR